MMNNKIFTDILTCCFNLVKHFDTLIFWSLCVVGKLLQGRIKCTPDTTNNNNEK